MQVKVSVAICTYNGAKYLKEQLDSILHQTRPVDEIVISDDGSTDDTMAILQQYATDYSYVRYAQNKWNKGYKQNFFYTLRQCTGDIIFLSDQDDVWHADKVERVLRWFDSHPKMQLVFTNASIVNGDGKPTGGNAFAAIGFDDEKQKAAQHGYMMDILFQNNRATGATMALRKDFIDSFKDEWGAGYQFHDYALVLEAFGKEVGGFMSESLIDYRVHGANATGFSPANHVFLSPYMHVCADFEGVNRWTDKTQRRIAFSRERGSFMYSWFGIKAIIAIPRYISMYNNLWYKAFAYDMKEAFVHSVERIKSKMGKS